MYVCMRAHEAKLYSNGPVWAQLITKENKMDLHDFAVGGATANNNIVQGYTVSNPPLLDAIA